MIKQYLHSYMHNNLQFYEGQDKAVKMALMSGSSHRQIFFSKRRLEYRTRSKECWTPKCGNIH